MKCPKCGNEYPAGLNYCIFCDGVVAEERRMSEIKSNSTNKIEEDNTSKQVFEKKLDEERRASEQAKENMRRFSDNIGENVNNTKERIKKNKKKIGVVASVASVAAAAVLAVAYVPACHNTYLNIRGAMIENSDPYGARECYSEAYDNGSLEALEGIIQTSLDVHQAYYAKQYIDLAKRDYSANPKLEEILAQYKPAEPIPNISSGTYTEIQRVTFSENDGNKVIYALDGGAFGDYHEALLLNQKQEYKVSAYTINSLDLQSEVVDFTYVLDIPVPQMVEANLEDGIYKTNVSLELSTDEDVIIYYTQNGTTPDKKSLVYSEPIVMSQGKNEIKAVAYDKNGTRGELYVGNIELQLPIPEDVQFSVEGGKFTDNQTLELIQEEGAKIYYTMDGSEPTRKSMLYTEPISLSFGETTVKAMAVNEFEQVSDIIEQTYKIAYEHYSRDVYTVSYRDYEYIQMRGDIYRFDKQLNDKTLIVADVDTFTNIQLYEDYLYYVQENKLHRVKVSGEEVSEKTEKVSDTRFETDFYIINDTVYFRISADQTLYKINVDGTDLTKVCVCGLTYGVIGDELYFSADGKIKTINENDGTITEKGDSLGSTYYIKDGVYYYEDYHSIVKQSETGKEIVAKKENSSYSTERKGLFGDRSETSTSTWYSELRVCHNSLYFLETYFYEKTTYDWLENDDRESRVTYHWKKLDLLTGNVSYTPVRTEDIYITDNMIMDADGNKYEVIN